MPVKRRTCHEITALLLSGELDAAWICGFHFVQHVDGFAYSPAMKGSGLTWDEATLMEYLRAPKKLVPGTKMVFPGVKNEEKPKDLIAYLKQATQ
jgi:cytochrome c